MSPFSEVPEITADQETMATPGTNTAKRLPRLRRVLRGDNEEAKIKKILRHLNRDSRVLDVGCGMGNKYRLLESLGFYQILGVEKNPDLVKVNAAKGRNVVSSSDFFERFSSTKYDLILMSHLIEHFQWNALLPFLESYLDLLEDNGYLLIVSPLYHTYFYGDFDHVKPYLPDSIRNIFGTLKQVQVKPKNRLELIDIQFRRAPFSLPFYRSLYIQSRNKLPGRINTLLVLLFSLSFRAIGKTTGWIGLFKKIDSSK